MKVGLFFFRPSLGGGTTTFAAHMFKAIEAAGHTPMILKVRDKPTEYKPRPFGKYAGVVYRNISIERAESWVRNFPTIMVAPAAEKYLARPTLINDLMKLGMRIVMHDPNEFSIYNHLNVGDNRKELKIVKLPTRPICIRPTMQKFYPKAVWIPHPYMRQCTDSVSRMVGLRHNHAISIARIASVKRPKIILEANRLLPMRKRVQLLGAEYRMYTYNLQKKYADVFKQSGKTFQFPMTFIASPDLCGNAIYNVDMTWFPDDGGGTQYAQMEAMDAGCVNIMHIDWLRFKGELKNGKHLLTVESPEDLAWLLKHGSGLNDEAQIRENGFKLLKKHAPKVVGELYMEELLR
jgi:hypothetical protein